jgi:HepT-like protein
MAVLREKVEAELEQIDRALGLLPAARKVSELSVLELGGTASLLSSLYHGIENIMKQALVSAGVTLPLGPAWHRDLLQSACEHGIVSAGLRDRLVPFMAFRHFFAHAYGFDLDPLRLQPLVRDAPVTCASFKQEIE